MGRPVRDIHVVKDHGGVGLTNAHAPPGSSAHQMEKRISITGQAPENLLHMGPYFEDKFISQHNMWAHA